MEKLFRNRAFYFLLLIMVYSLSCTGFRSTQMSEVEAAVAWGHMANGITRNTPANSPTFASRAFGYIGLCMYESVVNGYPAYRSMAGQLNGLEALPLPQSGQTYNWVLAMNAAQASMLKSIYQQTSDDNKVRIDSLEQLIYEHFSDTLNREVARRSVIYGRDVAAAVYEWSLTDGGHRGYLRNFDKKKVHPDRPGCWKPPLYAQSFSHHPLHPDWGNNRTFVRENRELPMPIMIPYDTLPDSPYYQQFLQVYEKEKTLTQKEKEAAIWWGDDPEDTFTPPGHSYYIATLAVESQQPELIKIAETYAKTGMAVADAFIKCWDWKYYFFTERPNTFITRFIDPEWESFWPDPPFPSFPSGHAIQAAAAATILEDSFGETFSFTDRAHEGRERDDIRDTDFVVRSFNSFWEAARETADSRFYGGIHTPQDNHVGLTEGVKIARNVLNLQWKNP